MEDIIKALEDFFAEYGRGRGMEYTYGFMDALAVIRANATVQRNGHPRRYTDTASTANDRI